MTKTVAKCCVLILSAVLCGCGKDGYTDDYQQPEVYNGPWALTVTTSAGGGGNRALTLGGDDGYKTLTCSWAAGEKVYVYKQAAGPVMNHVGTLTAQTSGSSTTLTGDLTGTFSQNDELYLYTQQLSATFYSGQDGTLERLAQNYDLMYDKVKVSQVDAQNHALAVSSQARFQTLRSICRFTFKDSNSQELKPTQLTISANGLVRGYDANWEPLHDTPTTLTFSLGGTTNVIYLSMADFLSGTTRDKTVYTFTATVGDKTYIGTKRAALNNGYYYATSITLTQQP